MDIIWGKPKFKRKVRVRIQELVLKDILSSKLMLKKWKRILDK